MKFSARLIFNKKNRAFIHVWGMLFFLSYNVSAFTIDPVVTSTRAEAIAFVDKIKELKPSSSWPNIVPELFLQNLKTNVRNPISIYPGKGTNFCGYGALTYLFLQDDPLGYATLLLQLYQDGKAKFGNVYFDPSPAVKLAAGQLKYKGLLDINPAEQMWFLTLAGHFKGYLNIFNRKYDPGDEDRFWASVNYAKFNRMAKSLLHYKVRARGADLMRPKGIDLYDYITDAMKTGPVVLFINNRIVHKKDHVTIKLGVPTHFVVAERISKADDVITLMYWDYGGKTQLQLSSAFFKRIVFGISHFTKTGTDVE
ncbi:MAG: hypothetical protein ABI685_00655 [Ferruginibacter sp.]